MKFPISFKKDTYLHGAKCDFCHSGDASRQFVSIAIGATQDYAKDDIVDLSTIEAAMSFGWQSSDDTVGAGFQVVSDTVQGEFCFNFCSTACLRSFLMSCVDHLESLIQKAKAKQLAKEKKRAKPK